MSTIINVKPNCLSKLRGEESYALLDSLMAIYKEGRTAVEVLKNIDYYDQPEVVVDYTDLFDLEDILIEKDADITGFGEIDRKEIVRYAKNACSYWNEACEILDIDSCSNTMMDCAEMLTKIEFAVSNSATFLYNIFSDLVKYVQYLINVSDKSISEQTKLQYPEFADVELNYSPEILEILRRVGEPESPETLIPFVNELISVLQNYRTQNTCILNYYSEYSEFYDFIERYNQVDIQESTGIIMPQDIKYVLHVLNTENSQSETVLEELFEKLNGRMGVIDGVPAMTYVNLDCLVWLAKFCKNDEDYEYLYTNERFVCSDLDLCYLCIARESIDLLRQAEGGLAQTTFF